MARLHEQTWESFSRNWNTDVKAAFHWIQAALNAPLGREVGCLFRRAAPRLKVTPFRRLRWRKANDVVMAGFTRMACRTISIWAFDFRRWSRAADRRHDRTRPRRRRSLCAPKRRDTEAFLAGFGKPLAPRADYGESW